jgi:flavodoxin
MKKLVVYYSFDGNTRFIAQAIAEEIGAEVLELKTLDQTRPEGFKKYFWGGRQVMMKEKPELLPFDKKIEDYDLIIIGTPVWAFSFTPALATFFSKVNIRLKKIALFCCSGGGPGKTIEKMKAQLAGNFFIGENHFKEPLRFKEKSALEAKAWAKELEASLAGNA